MPNSGGGVHENSGVGCAFGRNVRDAVNMDREERKADYLRILEKFDTYQKANRAEMSAFKRDVRKRLNRIRWTLIGILVSLATSSVLLFINLIRIAGE